MNMFWSHWQKWICIAVISSLFHFIYSFIFLSDLASWEYFYSQKEAFKPTVKCAFLCVKSWSLLSLLSVCESNVLTLNCHNSDLIDSRKPHFHKLSYNLQIASLKLEMFFFLLIRKWKKNNCDYNRDSFGKKIRSQWNRCKLQSLQSYP